MMALCQEISQETDPKPTVSESADLPDLDPFIKSTLLSTHPDPEKRNMLASTVSSVILRDARIALFLHALQSQSDMKSLLTLKPRRGKYVLNLLANDIISLYRHITGIDPTFPTDLATKREILVASRRLTRAANNQKIDNFFKSQPTKSTASDFPEDLNDSYSPITPYATDLTATSSPTPPDAVSELAASPKSPTPPPKSPQTLDDHAPPYILDIISRMQAQITEIREKHHSQCSDYKRTILDLETRVTALESIQTPVHPPDSPSDSSWLIAHNEHKCPSDNISTDRIIDEMVENAQQASPFKSLDDLNPINSTIDTDSVSECSSLSHFSLDAPISPLSSDSLSTPPRTTGSPVSSVEHPAAHLPLNEVHHVGVRPVGETVTLQMLADEIDGLRHTHNCLSDRVFSLEASSVDHQEKINSLERADGIDIRTPEQPVFDRSVRSEPPVTNHKSADITRNFNTNSNPRLNVSTNNRFSPLADHDSDTSLVDLTDESTPSNGRRLSRGKNKNKKHKKSNKKSINVKIVSSSIYGGTGALISDDFLGINACSMPAPGAKAEHIKQYLPGSTSEDDDILCLGAGTNNVPVDPVITCIDKIDDCINRAISLDPRRHIIIPNMPNRYDEQCLLALSKIRDINTFLTNKCAKTKTLHYVHTEYTHDDYQRDGLHLSWQGKQKFAANVKLAVRQITAC